MEIKRTETKRRQYLGARLGMVTRVKVKWQVWDGDKKLGTFHRRKDAKRFNDTHQGG